jgi:ATP-dependent exoDNAse (exonuclease V) beta subunit
MAPDWQSRTDIAFADAIDQFARWFAGTRGEPHTAALLDDLHALAVFYGRCLDSAPDFAGLWRLAHPARLQAMRPGKTTELERYRCKTRWKRLYGDSAGEELNTQAEAHFSRVDALYSELRGKIADGLVYQLSQALNEVLAAYTARKRNAAALDFDDLLHFAHQLVSVHEPVRAALGQRFPRILVDEFQDTDRVQASIIFLIAAETKPARWQDARLRPGSLFLVGDPKQAIYRFRGADIEAYREARATIAAQGREPVIAITANFRSQKTIIEHVNRCFEAPLQAPGQPGYVALTATIDDAVHGLPCAALVTIEFPPGPSAATQRDEEAVIVAQICKRLVGAVNVTRADGSVTPLSPGDVALLAPTGTDLWRYEAALEAAGLNVASQAGKALFRQQEAQDVLALLRLLADPTDQLAFCAFLRGPMVGLTDEELFDIAGAVHSASETENADRFTVRTPPERVAHPLAKFVLEALQHLRRRANATTPGALLSEAIERLQLRVIVAARHRSRSARALANLDALVERARPYDVSGLRAFVHDLQADWAGQVPRTEGRIDPSDNAIELVTIHSSKGLEWPVVIPINTSTEFRSPPQFVHRKSDNTLHWVVGGVLPPELAAARVEEGVQDGFERERMWYVACTRARDLLILPKLPAAPANSWAKALDLTVGELSELSLDHLPQPQRVSSSAVVNEQSREIFAAEEQAIAVAAPALRWRRPSDHDSDRAERFEQTAQALDDAFVFVEPVGAGQLRGIVLHKLMEEFLTGELADDDAAGVQLRAHELLQQLMTDSAGAARMPDTVELATTALRALRSPVIAELRPHLVSEVSVWANSAGGTYLAGRADAVAVSDGAVSVVIDWKSDVAPTAEERRSYVGQLTDYLVATGAPKGALVYMTIGEIVWVDHP